jgi:hypothetical protein
MDIMLEDGNHGRGFNHLEVSPAGVFLYLINSELAADSRIGNQMVEQFSIAHLEKDITVGERIRVQERAR